MSEMVERVARAMRAQEYDADEWDGTDSSDRYYWQTAARAAIAAMREPTSEMMDAYLDLEDPMDDDWPYNPPAAKPAWQVMIDAALKS